MVYDGFSQVVVWQSTIVDEVQEFMNFLSEEFNASFKWLGSFETNHQNEDGSKSVDVAFFVSDSDLPKFAIKRLQFGMRWLEDVVDNDPSHYPLDSEILKHYLKD